jgi:branched-chain amino acid transport system substrate-binding protein
LDLSLQTTLSSTLCAEEDYVNDHPVRAADAAVIDRRLFLKRFGLAGALAALAGTAGLALRAANSVTNPSLTSSSAPPIRVGVVLPQSKLAPQLGERMLAGMRLAVSAHASRDVELVPEWYGTSPSLAITHARQLVVDQQVDLLAGLFSRNSAASLVPALDERQTPLIISDIGANLVRDGQQHPLIVRSSLGYWQANMALGSWAARHAGKHAVIATSLYESGYDTIDAFRSGYEEHGGKVSGTIVSDGPLVRDASPAAVLAQIAALSPDVVYAAYSGDAAVAFVRAYADSELAGRAQLIGPGMLVDEALLPAMGRSAQGVQSAFTWSPALTTPHNLAFTAAYQAQAGQAPDAFALLGYDTGLLITSALDAVGRDGRDSAHLIAALHNVSLTTPRGRLSVGDQRELVSPIYLREVRLVGAQLGNAVLQELAGPVVASERLAQLRAGGRAGWTNAYLCV